MESTCPRCGRVIFCMPENITHCPCASIKVSPETMDHLSNTYYEGCLCNACLLEKESIIIRIENLATSPNQLQEGVHFYMEGDKVVFTELYHVQRGYCCKSGCRHCAYGYTKKENYSKGSEEGV